MVRVEDVSSSNSVPPRRSPSLLQILQERKIDALLLYTRLATIFFALNHFLPLFGANYGTSAYTKALLCSAATSALRLYQRISHFELSREFLLSVIQEDSAHYLMFAFLFLTGSHFSIVLIPISTYAMLHACSFLSQILTDFPKVKTLLDRITLNHVPILRFVALNEILLMPLLILSIFVVRANLLVIFLYYRFLTLRYTSRRNPYTRQLFSELRQSAIHLCNRPSCPPFVNRICYAIINFISRLAPATA